MMNPFARQGGLLGDGGSLSIAHPYGSLANDSGSTSLSSWDEQATATTGRVRRMTYSSRLGGAIAVGLLVVSLVMLGVDVSFSGDDIYEGEHAVFATDEEELPLEITEFFQEDYDGTGALGLESNAQISSEDMKVYLLITTHGKPDNPKTNNIGILDRFFNASKTSKKHWHVHGFALDEETVESLRLQNLRGIFPLKNLMFVASAHSSRSKIIVTKKCGRKPRKAKTFTVDGLDHPYGVVAYGGYLFATNQNDDTVVRFRLKDGLGAKAHKFAKVSHPRGLAFDNQGRLWVASTKKGVYLINGIGHKTHKLKIKHPIGIVCDRKTGDMYVGSAGGDPAIYAIDPTTLQIKATFRPEHPYRLKHPAGLAINEETRVLFVVAQDERLLYAFKLSTGAFIGAVSDLPPRPEQIALLHCKG